MIKNKIKLLLLLLILVSSCQAVKDGLTGKKNDNSDEFLVKRPIRDLVNVLRQVGCIIENDTLPLIIRPAKMIFKNLEFSFVVFSFNWDCLSLLEVNNFLHGFSFFQLSYDFGYRALYF